MHQIGALSPISPRIKTPQVGEALVMIIFGKISNSYCERLAAEENKCWKIMNEKYLKAF